MLTVLSASYAMETAENVQNKRTTSTDGYRFEFNTFNEYIITRKARRGRLTQ